MDTLKQMLLILIIPLIFFAGMPIKASSDKLQREIQQFGFPPKFEEQKVEPKIVTSREPIIVDKSKSRKVSFYLLSCQYKSPS